MNICKSGVAVALLVLLLMPLRALALAPDEIALLVNSKVPQGRELAELYAKTRHIPDNHIVELDLPTSEEMPFADFEQTVIPQVRFYLRSAGAGVKIKCFVTFFGVPLRIGDRVNSRDDNRELEVVQQAIGKTAGEVISAVTNLEEQAKELSPDFKPAAGHMLEDLARRAEAAAREINSQLPTISDRQRADEVLGKLYDSLELLAGDSAHVQRLSIQESTHPGAPASDQNSASASAAFKRSMESASQLEQLRYDPKAREQLRQLISQHFGLLGYVKLLQNQIDYFETNYTGSAFDSELSLVNSLHYSHVKWQNNPLFYGFAKTQPSSVIMVMRLDAPNPDIVKRIITESVQTEAQGLKGQFVIDGRGLAADQAKGADRGMAEFDQYFRNLAELLRDHSKIKVFQDDKPEVLPPDSAKDVALYCGWYSVRKYIPLAKFNPGAVGYHVASYEMQSIHNPGETGWVANLLNDGVDATLGAVAEPYLIAFPRPDDFFPVLLTGKLPLAEVYWRTIPLTSWNLAVIGDPLYTPYKNNPQLQPGDLPDRLRSVLYEATTQP